MSVAMPLAAPPLVQLAPRLAARPEVTGPVLLRSAQPGDVLEMAALLDGFARRGLLLPQTPDQLYRGVRDFVVAVDAHGLVGCAALRIYSPVLAEVGSLAVSERAHGHGVGRRLVEAVAAEAARFGVRRLFALTLQDGFFHRLGFETVSVSEFPEKVARDCAGCAKRAGCIEICVARDVGADTY